MQVIPPSLAAYRQFIIWIAAPSATRPGKMDKFPTHPKTGRKHNAHDPAIWMSAEEAQDLVKSGVGQGIGFSFAASDPFFFLDIDEALHDGQWALLAQQLCTYMRGCFVEISMSGTGLHIIGTGKAGEHACKYKAADCNVDLYTEGRFVALTGTGAYGNPGYYAQPQLDWLVENYFPVASQSLNPVEWTAEPSAEYTGPTDDDELINRMLASRSTAGAFSGRASVTDLWAANPDALALAYPPETDANPFDHSSADAALCAHLAFWAGKDCDRMDRLFRRSGLMRDKWERVDYMRSTVLGAVARCQAVYSHVKELPAVERSAECHGGFITSSLLADYFKGCVYIRDLHRVFTPDGSLLRSEQFRASWGGHTFYIDQSGEKSTRNAWEALTESQCAAFPQAHDACFRPELPSGVLIETEGRVLVNTYVPISTPCKPGDASPFLGHIAKMLPDPHDQAILLSYMAAVLQNPGKKFQWWPLVQGCEGNGKSLLIRVMEFCVGSRYCHNVNARDIDNKFNAWLRNKLFIGVEEIYTADRQDKIDALKPLITNVKIEIRGMAQEKRMIENLANWGFCTNYRDAILKSRGDRRYAMFFTAQQDVDDLARDGMDGQYFPRLYGWLRNEGGYAAVAHWLKHYPIPNHLNPATECHRAPTTSSTGAAIEAATGSIEREVVEACEDNTKGFRDGWISAWALDRLLREKNFRISRHRTIEMLLEMGFVEWGRAPRPMVEEDQKRPMLYRRTVGGTFDDYCRAQGYFSA